MSALPAEELTCGSDIRPPRALRPVPANDGAPSGPGAAAPSGAGGDTPETRRDTPAVPDDDTPAIRRDTPETGRDTPGARSVRRNETPAPPLRLTRRGRVVVAVAAALLVTVISLLVAGVAQATNDGPSARAARQHLVQVVVRPGQSLWSVAESADPDQDTRAVVQQIIDLNSLNGDTVLAGQQLWVPRG